MRIKEVELVPDVTRRASDKHSYVVSKKPANLDNTVKVATIRGYTIYVKPLQDDDERDNDVDTEFIAVNNSTGLTDITVDGWMKTSGNSSTFEIGSLSGRTSSNLKAYEFYRAILKSMNIIFVTDYQSYGGLRTWQELSKFKDITVFGWRDGEAINIDPLDPEETHAEYTDVYSGPNYLDVDKDLQDIMKMKLIAHRKIR